jgi:S1-C subfamily serine protease
MKSVHLLLLAAVMAMAPMADAPGKEFNSQTLPQSGAKSALKWNPLDADELAGRGPEIHAAREVLGKVGSVDAITTRGAAEVKLYANAAPAVVMIVTDDGLGSGSVLTKDGLIVTNWHVVAGYKHVGVLFKPETAGKEFTAADIRMAEVVRIDQVADLALLQMLATMPRGTKPIPMGKSKGLNVGDDVHAIGHPSSNGWTYTKGIVSQIRPGYKWKTESGISHEALVIQTQTPINPGNSGGPLLNGKGEMVGVNSFTAQGEGLNYAVSSDSVQAFLARSTDRMARTETKKNETTETGRKRARGDCEVETMFEGRTEDDDADMTAIDTDCDGIEDTMLIIPDKRSESIELIFFDGQTGELKGIFHYGIPTGTGRRIWRACIRREG